METALRRFVRDYQGLNSSTVPELEAVPSPLEFARYVGANRPCVIRGGARDQQLPALDRWTDDYLVEKLAEKALRISVTPSGYVRVHRCYSAHDVLMICAAEMPTLSSMESLSNRQVRSHFSRLDLANEGVQQVTN
jgi:hypothetical protein